MSANTANSIPSNKGPLLAEDDEFEEFAEEEWDDSETVFPGAEASKLWEWNWDDDNMEEEYFFVQLREAIKRKQADTSMVS